MSIFPLLSTRLGKLLMTSLNLGVKYITLTIVTIFCCCNCSFLREVCAHSTVNSMDSSNLAIIFAPTIFKPDMVDAMKAVMELKLAKLMLKEIIDRLSVLQLAMHFYTDRHNAIGEVPQKFIFENPIKVYDESLLEGDLASKMNISEVRNITDNFGSRFASRMESAAAAAGGGGAGAGGGGGHYSRGGSSSSTPTGGRGGNGGGGGGHEGSDDDGVGEPRNSSTFDFHERSLPVPPPAAGEHHRKLPATPEASAK
jgi:hypothetical protein